APCGRRARLGRRRIDNGGSRERDSTTRRLGERDGRVRHQGGHRKNRKDPRGMLPETVHRMDAPIHRGRRAIRAPPDVSRVNPDPRTALERRYSFWISALSEMPHPAEVSLLKGASTGYVENVTSRAVFVTRLDVL